MEVSVLGIVRMSVVRVSVGVSVWVFVGSSVCVWTSDCGEGVCGILSSGGGYLCVWEGVCVVVWGFGGLLWCVPALVV